MIRRRLFVAGVCLLSILSSILVAAVDSNLSNNVLSVNISVVETEELSVHYFPYFRTSADYMFDYDGSIETYDNYTQKIFPLADGNLKVNVTPFSQALVASVDSTHPVDYLFDFIRKINLQTGRREKVVGVVPIDFFWYSDYPSAGGYTSRHPCLQNYVFVLETKGFDTSSSQFTDTDRYHVLAHELGHTFGHLHPSGANCTYDNCPVADGALVTALFSNYLPDPHNQTLFHFMQNASYFWDNHWIDSSYYNLLIGNLSNAPPVFTRMNYTVVSGYFTETGSIVANPFYTYSDAGVSCTVSEIGDTVLKIYNGNQTILNISIQKDYGGIAYGSLENITSNRSYFLYIVPSENVTRFEFVNQSNNAVVLTRNVTPNTPSVNITTSLQNAVFESLFNISWSASDADNDTLAYAVLISADNGSSWTTLDFDLNETYFTLDNAWFSYGTQYKIKILATDGVNTGTATSNGTFTIVPPPSVAVESLSELYGAGPRKVVEGVILNDGGQTLNQTQWRLDTDAANITAQTNVSLVMNEQIFVIVEENYSSGGEKTATLYAEDTTKDVSANASLLIFVGDLRAGELYDLYGNVTDRIFEFQVWNNDGTNLSGVNWSFATGENNLSAQSPINVSANETVFVIIGYNYSDTGDYVTTASATDNFNSYSESLAVHIPDITILNLAVLSQQDERAVFGFELTNELNDAMNASWALGTGSELITSQNTTLSSGESVFVIAASNYTSYGDFTAQLNATDGRHNRSATTSISIAELLITGVQRLALDATRAVFEYQVTNNFSVNKTATWSFDTNDTGTITAGQAVTLTPDEGFFVILENNFTSTGTRTVVAGANTANKNYTQPYNTTI